jgi:SAM-dependent methyltransferase
VIVNLDRVVDAQRGSYRPTPMIDALSRGGPWPAGLCVEVGSGTGLLTPLLAQLWDPVLCVDLSAAMLRRGRGLRVQADAARLPVADGVAATVVIGDALLFAGEVVRALRPDGAVVWSNALGDGAPYHVPTPVASAAGGAKPSGLSDRLTTRMYPETPRTLVGVAGFERTTSSSRSMPERRR